MNFHRWRKLAICYQLELGNLPMIRLNTLSEEVWVNIAIHYLRYIHRRSKVVEDYSSLPASTSQWPSNQELPIPPEFVLTEVLLWGCHLEVQSLLHQQLVDRVVVPPTHVPLQLISLTSPGGAILTDLQWHISPVVHGYINTIVPSFFPWWLVFTWNGKLVRAQLSW